MGQLVTRPRAARQTERGLIHGRNEEIFLPFNPLNTELNPICQ